MLSSSLRKVMKALLILLAAAWIATDANATSEGERAPGLADKRFVSSYLYAAVRPATDDAFALVLPEVDANTMASCCSIKPDGTARRRSRCRWEEPSTASKACIFLFFTSCPGLTGVID